MSVHHTLVISKWIKISSVFFLGLVAQPLWFSNTTYVYEIMTGREPVTRVDLDIFGLTTLNNGSARTSCRYFFLPLYDKLLLLSLLLNSTRKPALL